VALHVSVPFNERKFVKRATSRFSYVEGITYKEYLGVASAAVEAEGIGVNKSSIRDVVTYLV
jgi:hypothetical protein